LEAKAVRPGKPSAEIDTGDPEGRLRIQMRSAHADFIVPVTAMDVRETLTKVPTEFLVGLSEVFVLGGTSKQLKSIRLFRYGTYARNQVFLHSYPRSQLIQFYSGALDPATAQEYEAAGAKLGRDGSNHYVQFDEASLRRFYLFAVLLHEVGHHVDSRVFDRPTKDAERFANWFASSEARRIWDET